MKVSKARLEAVAKTLAEELQCAPENVNWDSLREAYAQAFPRVMSQVQQAKARAVLAEEQDRQRARRWEACRTKTPVRIRARDSRRVWMRIAEYRLYPEEGLGEDGRSWEMRMERGHGAEALLMAKTPGEFLFRLEESRFPSPHREPGVYYVDTMTFDGLASFWPGGFINDEVRELWQACLRARQIDRGFEFDPNLWTKALPALEKNPCYVVQDQKGARPLVKKFNDLFPGLHARSVEEMFEHAAREQIRRQVLLALLPGGRIPVVEILARLNEIGFPSTEANLTEHCHAMGLRLNGSCIEAERADFPETYGYDDHVQKELFEVLKQLGGSASNYAVEKLWGCRGNRFSDAAQASPLIKRTTTALAFLGCPLPDTRDGISTGFSTTARAPVCVY